MGGRREILRVEHAALQEADRKKRDQRASEPAVTRVVSPGYPETRWGRWNRGFQSQIETISLGALAAVQRVRCITEGFRN